MLLKKKNGIPSMRSREYREGGKTVTLSITYIKWSFLPDLFIASIAQAAERQSVDRWIPGSNPSSGKHFFPLSLLFFYLEMLLLYVKTKNGRFLWKCYISTLKVLFSNILLKKYYSTKRCGLDRNNLKVDYDWFKPITKRLFH